MKTFTFWLGLALCAVVWAVVANLRGLSYGYVLLGAVVLGLVFRPVFAWFADDESVKVQIWKQSSDLWQWRVKGKWAPRWYQSGACESVAGATNAAIAALEDLKREKTS